MKRCGSSASDAASSLRTSSNSPPSPEGRAPLLPFELDALVNEQRRVAAVIEDHVRAVGVRPHQSLLGAPPVLLERLALPREDGDTLRVPRRTVGADGDGSGRLVLGGEDVAGGPADLRTKHREGLDEHGGLHGHVQGSGDASTAQRLTLAVLVTHGHEAGHLVLGQTDLVPTGCGQERSATLKSIAPVSQASCRGAIGGGIYRSQAGGQWAEPRPAVPSLRWCSTKRSSPVALVVQKYGGSSVADAASIKRVAARIVDTQRAGNQVTVVVSAMGDSTDELMDLAQQVSPTLLGVNWTCC